MFKISVREPQGKKRPHHTIRCKWEDNIKIDLREIESEDEELINLRVESSG